MAASIGTNEIILQAYDAHIELKEEQKKALLCLMERQKDLNVNLPVEYGKSLIYHL
jgi:superfamily II DNA helicase RecQ